MFRSQNPEAASTALKEGADTFGILEDIELLDPDADTLDPWIREAGGADPLTQALAEIDMTGAVGAPPGLSDEARPRRQ